MSSKNSGIVCRVVEGKYEGCRAIAYHHKQMPTITEAGKCVVTIFQDMDSFEVVAENIIISVDKLQQVGFCD